MEDLERDLCEMTGQDSFALQSNRYVQCIKEGLSLSVHLLNFIVPFHFVPSMDSAE